MIVRLLFAMALRRARLGWRSLLLLGAGVAVAVSVFLAVVRTGEASIASFAESTDSLHEVIEIRARSSSLSMKELQALGERLGPYAHVTPVFERWIDGPHGLIQIIAVDGLGVGLVPPEGMAENWAYAAPELLARLELRSGEMVTLPDVYSLPPIVIAGVVPNEAMVATNVLLFDLSSAPPLLLNGGASYVRVSQLATRSLGEARALEFEGALRSLEKSYLIERSGVRQERLRKMLAAFRFNIVVMMVMTLFLAAFTVFTAAQIGALQLEREIAILNLLGISRVLAALPLLFEAAIVGLVGSAIGAAIGPILSTWVARLVLRSVEAFYTGGMVLPHQQIWDHARSQLLAAGVAVLLSLAGALYPALRMVRNVNLTRLRSSASYALHPTRAVPLWLGVELIALWSVIFLLVVSPGAEALAVGYALIALIMAAVIFSVTPLLALLGSLRTRIHSLYTLYVLSSFACGSRARQFAVATTALGVSLLIGLGIMVHSFRCTLLDWMNSTLKADLFLRAAGPSEGGRGISPELHEQLTRSPGVEKVARFASREGEVSQIVVRVAGSDFFSGKRYREFQSVAGRPLSEDSPRSHVMLSESAARRLRRWVGDTVLIRGQPFEVVNIFRDYTNDRGLVLMSLDQFLRVYPEGTLESLAVYGTDELQSERGRRAIVDLATPFGVRVIPNAELRASVIEIFDTTFAITTVMRTLVLIICTIGFLITMVQLVWLEQAQFQTLYKLGMSRRKIARTVVIEGALLASCAALLGVLGGELLAIVLVDIINPAAFGWSLQRTQSLTAFGAAFGAVSLPALGMLFIASRMIPTLASLGAQERDE